MNGINNFHSRTIFSEDIKANKLMEKFSKVRQILVEKYIRYKFPVVSRQEASEAISRLASKDPIAYTEKEREIYFRLCPEIKEMVALREEAIQLTIEVECD